MKKALYILFLLITQCAFGQKVRIEIRDSARKTSIRGLSVVNNTTIWASGSNGQIAKSVNGGKTFVWLTVKGYEKRDFRDIEAFNDSSAIIIGIAEPAIILKTNDGGNTWKKVFEDSTKGMFLDAIDFDEFGNGMVIGDPIQGKLFCAITNDWGNSWQVQKTLNNQVDFSDGEAFFASSGSNLVYQTNGFFWVSGGKKSRFFLQK